MFRRGSELSMFCIAGLFHRIDSSSSATGSASGIRQLPSLLCRAQWRTPVRRQEHLAKRHFLSPDAESRAADGTPLAVRRGEPRRKDSAAAERQTYQSRRSIAVSERFAGHDSTTIPSRPSGRTMVISRKILTPCKASQGYWNRHRSIYHFLLVFTTRRYA